MKTRLLTTLVLALALALTLVACDGDGGGETPSATATTGGSAETPEPTPTLAADVCLANPDPATPDVAVVESPSAGESVASPVTVSGSYAAFEAQFNITIYDAEGGKIADAAAHSAEGQTLSSFSQDVTFSVTEDTPACVWVYDVSEADGVTQIGVVQIPVLLTAGGSVCRPNPDPATPEFQVLDEPAPNLSVSSPVTVSGQVLYFENTYQVAIYDADGNVITETFGTAVGTEIGQLASFAIDVPFEVDEATPACLWIYEASAMDESPVHVGQIPILLLP